MPKRVNLLDEESVAKRPKILPTVTLSDAPVKKKINWINRERVLFKKTSTIRSGYKKLIENIITLSPHAKKSEEVVKKKHRYSLKDDILFENCSKLVYFEGGMISDLYLWMAHIGKNGDGPTIKFCVKDGEPCDMMKFPGNCLRGSRPILSFSDTFDKKPELQIVKEMFTQVFGVPNNHPKSQPFIDRILNFTVVKRNIVIRHYQIADFKKNTLIDIGPNLTLEPIKIFTGIMGGKVIYKNDFFIRPRIKLRDEKKLEKAAKTKAKANKEKCYLKDIVVDESKETDIIFQ